MSVKPATKEITFKSLGLNPALIKTLDQQGITNPFPIQAATIPDAIAGHDILGRGQTGSGKTLAFGLALLHNIYGMRAKAHQPLALVLAPTRELAQQIDEVLRPLARSVGHGYSIVLVGVAGVFLVSSNVIQPSPACNTLYHRIHSPACYSIATRIHTSPSLLLNGMPLMHQKHR